MQDRFWQTPWKISHQSDRAGYRLAGPPLTLPTPVELRSYGLVSGIIQVPPSGVPIIQLSDANTAGGYPKMAAVIEADLWRLAQARLGSRIRFKDVEHAEGVEAMAPVEAYLESVRRTAELTRTL
jgi:allophanate hydrolase subunit 2